LKLQVPQNTLCVNVGKPCKRKRADETNEDFLQIIENQLTGATLSPKHTSDMIDYALRFPGANAALIDREGLEELGIKGDQQHLVSSHHTSVLT
jgi:hypothetical protein